MPNAASISDLEALTVTPPAESKTAFGEQSVAEPTPIIQVKFTYSVNTALVDVRENQSGTVTHSNRQAVLSTGAATNSSAEIRSLRILKYNPGQGAMARFTAKFSAGVAGSTQVIGIGIESDGLFFGYNGTSFGVLHRRNGSPEVRTLTVSTGSSTNESITITLDGVTASVAVTNTGSTTLTANEIAAHDYSDTGAGWTAKAVGPKVEFTSWNAATHAGTYSLSGASTAVGSFAQNVAGAAPTETWTAQENWNGRDKFDGAGLTGVNLDPTKGNVFQVKYQWLGYGLLSFYVEDPDDGELHLVHAIAYSNANSAPSLGDPSMAISANVTNTSNATAVTLATASMAAFVEGKEEFVGVRLGARSTKTDVTTSLRPILSVRQGTYFNSKAVKTFCKILRGAFAVEHSKPVNIVIIEDGALTGASFSRISGGVSAMEVDTAATAISGGTETWAVPLGQKGNELVAFTDDYFAYNITPGKVVTFAGIANSGTLAEVSVALELLERL